jgi:hypothetical protein
VLTAASSQAPLMPEVKSGFSARVACRPHLDHAAATAIFEDVLFVLLLMPAADSPIDQDSGGHMTPFFTTRVSGRITGAVLLAAVLTGSVAMADEHGEEGFADVWLPSLITETPQEGFALAVTLSQKGVATTQPDAEVRKAQRSEYEDDPDSLIAASHVIATHFQTVAAANDYWRE